LALTALFCGSVAHLGEYGHGFTHLFISCTFIFPFTLSLFRPLSTDTSFCVASSHSRRFATVLLFMGMSVAMLTQITRSLFGDGSEEADVSINATAQRPHKVADYFQLFILMGKAFWEGFQYFPLFLATTCRWAVLG